MPEKNIDFGKSGATGIKDSGERISLNSSSLQLSECVRPSNGP